MQFNYKDGLVLNRYMFCIQTRKHRWTAIHFLSLYRFRGKKKDNSFWFYSRGKRLTVSRYVKSSVSNS